VHRLLGTVMVVAVLLVGVMRKADELLDRDHRLLSRKLQSSERAPSSSFLVVFPPQGDRCFSEDAFPPELATRQRLDSADQASPQSVHRSDATAEREPGFVGGHPIPNLLWRKRATLASPFALCLGSFGRRIESDVRVRLRDRHAPMSPLGSILRPGRIHELATPFSPPF
jgi:hypothetical protein